MSLRTEDVLIQPTFFVARAVGDSSGDSSGDGAFAVARVKDSSVGSSGRGVVKESLLE